MSSHVNHVLDLTVNDLDGHPVALSTYKGKTLLLVNVASKCGFTPQYKGLEALYEKYKDQGFLILGFPCNDFGGQEPGTAAEIRSFCSTKYDVKFPLFAKVHAKGPEQDPIYTFLTTQTSASLSGEIKWNFTKFLVAPSGEVVARFEPNVEPLSPELTQAVEANLPKSH